MSELKSDVTQEVGGLPIIPCRNVVVFPGRSVPMSIGRDASMRALESAVAGGGLVLAVPQKANTDSADVTPDILQEVGTVCRIEKVMGSTEHGYQAVLLGQGRFRITKVETLSDRLEAYGEMISCEQGAAPAEIAALMSATKVLAQSILKLVPVDTEQLEQLIEGVEDPESLLNLCAENIDASMERKYPLLAVVSLRERFHYLLDLMSEYREALKVQLEIGQKLSRKVGKQQREALLRQQMRAIQEELGDDESSEGGHDLRKKLDAAAMPEDVRKVAMDELRRLDSMGASSPSSEAHIIRQYLETLAAIPWSQEGASEVDLSKARQVLDRDHFGLDKVKERLVQHLAVMKLRGDRGGSILLLVGPPGVGKTSLGRSIAEAMGRKFARVSLGGVRDEAEIRGHRRTYVGAMPGRIVQSMKRVGERNPVLLLDEIDKLGQSHQGDPAAALLEVLDPEQNSSFTDHYLDVPFDLSKVMFICTANSLESIPAPLLDRLEVVRLAGYTAPEKLHIAKRHLVVKQLSEHGIAPAQVQFSDEALLQIISRYTREAGVRELQRQIAAVCRGVTERVLSLSAGESFQIGLAEVAKALGPERYTNEVTESLQSPGVVTGLAWTAHGGDILLIETTKMPGSGRLTLTGQLGDVMKESAQIALSLVRSHIAALIPDHDKIDIHIHAPAGAIPKDGPSAGVTLLTALAGLLANRPVRGTLAMTGEITLRGAVLPVGGIKEKLVAAHRAGVTEVILPKRNEKDLIEVPEEVRSQLKIHYAERVQDVLRVALGIGSEGNTWRPALPESMASGPSAPSYCAGNELDQPIRYQGCNVG